MVARAGRPTNSATSRPRWPGPTRAYISRVKKRAPTPFNLNLNGVRWSADWKIEGDEIVIRSAYGSRIRKVGRRKPERLAEDLLLEILRARLAICEARRAACA